MRRFLFAAGLLATVAVTEADAGYFVVRIILEGGGGAGGGDPGAPGGLPGIGPGGEGGPILGGQPPRGAMPGPGPGMPGMIGPGAGAGGAGAAHDPTRSVFVVVPVTKSPEGKGRHFYPKLVPSPTFNPTWNPILSHPFGTTNLLVDSTQIQLYAEFAQVPAATKTRTGLIQSRRDDWKRAAADDGPKLLDLVNDALAAGMVGEAVGMADELLAAAQAKKVRTSPQVDRFVAAYAPVQQGLKTRVTNVGEGPAWKARLGLGFSDVSEETSAHYYMITWGGPRGEEARRRLAQLEENLKAFYLWHAARGVGLPLPDRLLPVALTAAPQDLRRLRDALDAPHPVADGFYAPDHGLLVVSPDRVDDVGMTFQRQVNGFYRTGVSRDKLLHPEWYTGPDSPIVKLNNDNNPNIKDGKRAEDVARMMTWAMADAFNQRETELSTVSREGCRQLFHASGILPRNVSLPAWLASGSADFFHRPRGAVFTTTPDHKAVATLGLTTGYGGPNFAQQKLFRDLVDTKLLPGDAATLLRNVVTDVYFGAVTARLDADDPKLPRPKTPPPPGAATTGQPGSPLPGPGLGGRPQGPGGYPGGSGPGGYPGAGGSGAGGPQAESVEDPLAYARRRQEFLTNKARSTSWALYYHLTANHPDGLRRFFAELDKLPRDLPLDGNAQLAVFMTAFNLTSSTTPEAGKTSFSRFAAEWLQGMATTPMAGVDLTLVDPAPPISNPQGGVGGPGGPGSPGGYPGAPGGPRASPRD
jgi:hypothetical protein